MSSDANPKLPTSIDLEAVRAKLVQEGASASGRASKNCPRRQKFHDFLEERIPRGRTEPGAEIGRRDVLKIAAASAALAGLSACTKLPPNGSFLT